MFLSPIYLTRVWSTDSSSDKDQFRPFLTQDVSGRGACYLLSTALDFPEEERMMQQSSVSISLSF